MEAFLGDLLTSLAARGVHVDALVHQHATGGAPDHQQPGAPTCAPAVHRVPSHGSLLYTPFSPLFPVFLRESMSRLRPDILHLHLPNPSAFWVLADRRARQLPWIIQWHADALGSRDKRLGLAGRAYRPFETRLLARARAVIASSAAYADTSEALTRWREKVRVIPLGIDPSRIPRLSAQLESWANESWGTGDQRVLSVGRLTYYKGHEWLVRAAARLDGLRVLIVGGGECRRHLERLISDLGVGQKVFLLGIRSDSELHALMATSHCVCLPSIDRAEAFGVVLLEAMLHAKPVVASAIPGSGVGWVVAEEETGLLVPPADAGALADALHRVFGDPERAAEWGRQGRRRVENFFRIGPVADRILSLYREVSDTAGSSRSWAATSRS